MIQPGEKAPSLTLKNVEGQAMALADTWQQQPTLLVFLRHLG